MKACFASSAFLARKSSINHAVKGCSRQLSHSSFSNGNSLDFSKVSNKTELVYLRPLSATPSKAGVSVSRLVAFIRQPPLSPLEGGRASLLYLFRARLLYSLALSLNLLYLELPIAIGLSPLGFILAAPVGFKVGSLIALSFCLGFSISLKRFIAHLRSL